MEMTRKTILAIIAGCAMCASAQELHENLRVEGQYIPDVIRQDKIRMLPTRLQLKTILTPLKYEQEGVVASYRPDFTALSAAGWHTERRLPDTRGYLDLAAGNFLDITGSAGYRFVDTDDTEAGFMLQHNSTSLFRPRTGGPGDGRYRYRYDETIGLYGSHQFADAGTLSARLYWHAGLFNYYGATGDFRSNGRFPTQTLNDLYISAGWNAAQKGPLTWNGEVYYRYFGYRSAYTLDLPSRKGTRESQYGVSGDLSYTFSNASSIGGDIRFDGVSYCKPEGNIPLDGYSNLTLTPRYRYSSGNLSLQAGANLDFTFNAGPEGDRYSLFHISPAVSAGWRSGIAGLWLRAQGGTELQTLSALYEKDYYQNPELTSTLPVYTPADISAGLNVGPFAGLTAGLSVAWKYSRHVPAGGWYMSTLCPGYSYPAVPAGYAADLLARGEGMDIKGFSLGIYIDGKPADFLNFHGDVKYQPQNGEKGYFNGYDRPRWIFHGEIEVKPIEPVKLRLGYEYRGVRTIYALYKAQNTAGLPFTPDDITSGMRLPDITDLSAGISWAVTDRFTVWGEATNLLDRRVMLLPQEKGEGFGFQIGFGLKF